jgi:hypothetical protein
MGTVLRISCRAYSLIIDAIRSKPLCDFDG